ncbi:MAG: hypothetical protein L0I24_04810, partial [Pseudonocardia sp.]|nr:hypothetical protein [Pseudonocardia sp.]
EIGQVHPGQSPRAAREGYCECRAMTWLPRTLGVLTAVCGLSTLVRPAIFAKPARLSGDEPPAPGRRRSAWAWAGVR